MVNFICRIQDGILGHGTESVLSLEVQDHEWSTIVEKSIKYPRKEISEKDVEEGRKLLLDWYNKRFPDEI